MKMSKSYQDHHLVITIAGAFDTNTIDAIREHFEYIHIEAEDFLVFDLSKTLHIDSSGIDILTYIHRRVLPRNIKMILLGLNGQPRHLLALLNVDKQIECLDSMADFLAKYINGK